MLRKSLRDELQASDAEKAEAALLDAIATLDEIERELAAAEQRLWQPHWSKNDPLDKRLRRVGMADATVDMVVCLMSGWEAFNRGEPFSAATNALLDQHEQSVASADRQLATILEQRAAPDF